MEAGERRYLSGFMIALTICRMESLRGKVDNEKLDLGIIFVQDLAGLGMKHLYNPGINL
jgi:hypothetical protein